MLTTFVWHELSCVSIGHVWPFVSFPRWNVEKTSIRSHASYIWGKDAFTGILLPVHSSWLHAQFWDDACLTLNIHQLIDPIVLRLWPMLTFFAWHELSCVSIGHVWPFVSFLGWNLEKVSIRMHHMSEVRTPSQEYFYMLPGCMSNSETMHVSRLTFTS